jgi:hypothetical protein
VVPRIAPEEIGTAIAAARSHVDGELPLIRRAEGPLSCQLLSGPRRAQPLPGGRLYNPINPAQLVAILSRAGFEKVSEERHGNSTRTR